MSSGSQCCIWIAKPQQPVVRGNPTYNS